MYSRNYGRERSTDDYDEFYGDESDEEYELYSYNLPPRYDGSRFRRRTSESKPPKRKSPPPDILESVSEHKEESGAVSCPKASAESGNVFEKLLSVFGNKFGYEEILIIALILVISGEENCAETLLILALLLIA